MNISTEAIEKYAYHLFTPDDIADVLEIDREKFYDLLRFDEPTKKAFKQGYLKKKLEINKIIFSDDSAFSNDEKELMLKKFNDFKTQTTILL